MILGIPADHPSVITMLREIGNDVDPFEVDRDLKRMCHLTQRREGDFQALAVDDTHDGLEMLLRRVDGALVHAVMEEEDEEGPPQIYIATMTRLTPTTGPSMQARFSDWARRSEMKDARGVLARLLDDAAEVPEPRADVVLDDRLALEDVLVAAGEALPEIRDPELLEIVRRFIRDANGRLSA